MLLFLGEVLVVVCVGGASGGVNGDDSVLAALDLADGVMVDLSAVGFIVFVGGVGGWLCRRTGLVLLGRVFWWFPSLVQWWWPVGAWVLWAWVWTWFWALRANKSVGHIETPS